MCALHWHGRLPSSAKAGPSCFRELANGISMCISAAHGGLIGMENGGGLPVSRVVAGKVSGCSSCGSCCGCGLGATATAIQLVQRVHWRLGSKYLPKGASKHQLLMGFEDQATTGEATATLLHSRG